MILEYIVDTGSSELAINYRVSQNKWIPGSLFKFVAGSACDGPARARLGSVDQVDVSSHCCRAQPGHLRSIKLID